MTQPTDPCHHTGHSEPEEPTEPVEPIEPTAPTDPNDPGEIGKLVNLLTIGLTFTALYRPDHPRVENSAEEFCRRLEDELDEKQQDTLFLGTVKGRLVYDGRLLLGPTLISKRLVGLIEKFRAGGFLLHRDLAPRELIDMFALGNEAKQPFDHVEQVRQALKAKGILRIEVSAPYGSPGWMGPEGIAMEDVEALDDLSALVGLYQSAFDTVEHAHSVAAKGEEVDLQAARSTVESVMHAVKANADDMMQLARYQDYDSYTIGHSIRVALFAMMVAHRFGLDDRRLVEIGTAALMHDVGKSMIPHEILYKPDRLSAEEMRVMQKHAWLGGQILLETRDATPMSVAAAFGHHVGSKRLGYPSQPRWSFCGPVTALVHVCDVFEALTAERPYKPALDPMSTYEIMLREKESFDPTMLSLLIRTMGCYPPGSNVRLSTGEVGTVIQAGRSLDRPVLRISHDCDDAALPISEQPIVDLAKADPRDVRIEDFLFMGS